MEIPLLHDKTLENDDVAGCPPDIERAGEEEEEEEELTPKEKPDEDGKQMSAAAEGKEEEEEEEEEEGEEVVDDDCCPGSNDLGSEVTSSGEVRRKKYSAEGENVKLPSASREESESEKGIVVTHEGEPDVGSKVSPLEDGPDHQEKKLRLEANGSEPRLKYSVTREREGDGLGGGDGGDGVALEADVSRLPQSGSSTSAGRERGTFPPQSVLSSSKSKGSLRENTTEKKVNVEDDSTGAGEKANSPWRRDGKNCCAQRPTQEAEEEAERTKLDKLNLDPPTRNQSELAGDGHLEGDVKSKESLCNENYVGGSERGNSASSSTSTSAPRCRRESNLTEEEEMATKTMAEQKIPFADFPEGHESIRANEDEAVVVAKSAAAAAASAAVAVVGDKCPPRALGKRSMEDTNQSLERQASGSESRATKKTLLGDVGGNAHNLKSPKEKVTSDSDDERVRGALSRPHNQMLATKEPSVDADELGVLRHAKSTVPTPSEGSDVTVAINEGGEILEMSSLLVEADRERGQRRRMERKNSETEGSLGKELALEVRKEAVEVETCSSQDPKVDYYIGAKVPPQVVADVLDATLPKVLTASCTLEENEMTMRKAEEDKLRQIVENLIRVPSSKTEDGEVQARRTSRYRPGALIRTLPAMPPPPLQSTILEGRHPPAPPPLAKPPVLPAKDRALLEACRRQVAAKWPLEK